MAGVIYKALVLLVIACPCALVISTPVTIVSGLLEAAPPGFWLKWRRVFRRRAQLAWLALDKTGTITHGKSVQLISSCSARMMLLRYKASPSALPVAPIIRFRAP
ncbi:hypothetical protein ABHF33_07285 [Chitinibacter sp. FCG-7]|uniref:Cation-translocating P-type ATPase n=1 Tax=Chitinibacter mangrovi TaxID=3153927 RepID=A0AAU7FCY3_9NEIS